jgi:hypothetical protein
MLHANTLQELDLSYNRISILRNASFSSYSRVSTLTLSNNEIEEIEISTFAELPLLRDVDLGYNNLKSFNPEIFSSNPVLENLSLEGNPIAFLSSDSPILISASVSFLDLSHCSLISLNTITFSRLPSLYSLDLSSNLLQTISVTAFEELPDLRILKLNNNRWTCNCNILELMQWLTVRRQQAPAHKPVRCLEGQTYRKGWTMASGIQSCRPSTTTEKLVEPEREFTTDMTGDLPTVSGGISQSPESETGVFASLDNTLMVFVILPITLGVAVFVSLIAVNCITKGCMFRSSQHEIREKENHNAGFFSHLHVPFLNPRLTADHTKQHAGYVNRSSYGVGGTEYHVYERI